MDEDGDGTIDFDEFRRYLDRQGMSVLHQDSTDLMSTIDTNGDGVLQPDEVEAFLTMDHLVS